jgi:hypothetical protein
MLIKAGTSHYHKLLTTEKGLQAVTKWLLRHDGLAQFARARAEALRLEGGKEWQELEALW